MNDDNRMRHHTVTLDPETARKARLIGDGSLSLGLRRAVLIAHHSPEMVEILKNPNPPE